jgi:hypothetical protein
MLERRLAVSKGVEESGSHMTRCWRGMDSNPRSPVRETSIFEICPFDITFPLPQ